jgi:hypothetical protein
MSDIIPISQLPPLTISQAANLDVLPITHDSDIVTYKISLQTLDAFIKTSPSSSKYFSGSIDCAVIATSSLSSSYLTYTGTNNGTSSYSMQSLTSSYSVSSSYVSTSSYANIAAFALSTTQTSINTASLAYTASFLYYNQSGVIPNGTASYAVSGGFAKSSSYALSSSYSNNSTTSSYARTSSFINTPKSLSSNGYTYLGNGLIMQWGVVVLPASNTSGTTVYFPITFPTAALNIVCTPSYLGHQTAGDKQWWFGSNNLTTSNVSLYFYSESDNVGTNMYWQALGY